MWVGGALRGPGRCCAPPPALMGSGGWVGRVGGALPRLQGERGAARRPGAHRHPPSHPPARSCGPPPTPAGCQCMLDMPGLQRGSHLPLQVPQVGRISGGRAGGKGHRASSSPTPPGRPPPGPPPPPPHDPPQDRPPPLPGAVAAAVGGHEVGAAACDRGGGCGRCCCCLPLAPPTALAAPHTPHTTPPLSPPLTTPTPQPRWQEGDALRVLRLAAARLEARADAGDGRQRPRRHERQL